MMHKSLLPRLGALAAGMLLAATAAAQNKPAPPNAAAAATNAPAVAEPADRLIKEMSAYIGSANEFTLMYFSPFYTGNSVIYEVSQSRHDQW